MVTFAQAQERAEEWINGDVASYQHREVRVREFELGFVVWAIGWFVLFLAREIEDLGLNFGVLVVGAIAAIVVGIPLVILLLPSSRRWAMGREFVAAPPETHPSP